MENEKTFLFDNPHNVKRILHILYGCCAVLFVLDFDTPTRHPQLGKSMGFLCNIWVCRLCHPGAGSHLDA